MGSNSTNKQPAGDIFVGLISEAIRMQFLNGLRFLSLVYVCLWTALAARRVDE